MTFELGQRVISVNLDESKDVGTVRYFGKVGNTKGEWVGVEWDDTSRGKHDGSHEGQGYFVTKTPTSGSFVRPSKLGLGIGFLEALAERYETPDKDYGVLEDDVLSELKQEFNAPFVELVGFDKITQRRSHLDKLQLLSLDKATINSTNKVENLDEKLPRVKELNLGDNLFSDWQDVVHVCQQLKRLKILTLNGNRMAPLKDHRVLNSAFKNVVQLNMGRMDLAWTEIESIVANLPQLELLHVHENRIQSVGELEPSVLQNLTELKIADNPLDGWDQVMVFSKLPKLKLLHVGECGIARIQISDECRPCFPALTWIYLSYNKIDNWESVAELNKLNIEDMKFRINPIMEELNGETTRQMFIASIKSLKTLNGTEITKMERYGAELDYLKRFGLEYLSIVKESETDQQQQEESLAAFFKRHPRYPEHLKTFGPPMEEELKVEKKTLKSKLIEVNIEYVGCEPGTKKKIPPSLTVLKLKNFLQRVTKVKSHLLDLSYRSADQPDMVIDMDNDMRDLSYYSISEGDTIIIKANA